MSIQWTIDLRIGEISVNDATYSAHIDVARPGGGVINGSANIQIDRQDERVSSLWPKLRDDSVTPSDLQALGAWLAESVFVDDIDSAYGHSLYRKRSELVRVRLDIPPSLFDLPWEFIHYERATQGHPSHRLCTRRHYGVFRRVPPAAEWSFPRQVSGAVRLLAVGACPNGYPKIALGDEFEHIREVIAELGTVEWIEDETLPRDHISPGALRECIQRHSPDIVHIVAHGSVTADQGCLVLCDPATPVQAREISAEALVDDVLTWGQVVPFVVISACYSLPLAHYLARCGIPSIGMVSPILGEAATEFSGGLYAALSEGLPVDFAANRGRSRVAYMDNPSRGRHWGFPALCCHEPDLFVLDQPPDHDVPIHISSHPPRAQIWLNDEPYLDELGNQQQTSSVIQLPKKERSRIRLSAQGYDDASAIVRFDEEGGGTASVSAIDALGNALTVDRSLQGDPLSLHVDLNISTGWLYLRCDWGTVELEYRKISDDAWIRLSLEPGKEQSIRLPPATYVVRVRTHPHLEDRQFDIRANETAVYILDQPTTGSVPDAPEPLVLGPQEHGEETDAAPPKMVPDGTLTVSGGRGHQVLEVENTDTQKPLRLPLDEHGSGKFDLPAGRYRWLKRR